MNARFIEALNGGEDDNPQARPQDAGGATAGPASCSHKQPGHVTTLADLAQAGGTRLQDRRHCADPAGIRRAVRVERVARALRGGNL